MFSFLAIAECFIIITELIASNFLKVSFCKYFGRDGMLIENYKAISRVLEPWSFMLQSYKPRILESISVCTSIIVL